MKTLRLMASCKEFQKEMRLWVGLLCSLTTTKKKTRGMQSTARCWLDWKYRERCGRQSCGHSLWHAPRIRPSRRFTCVKFQFARRKVLPSEDGFGYTQDICAECWTERNGGDRPTRSMKKEHAEAQKRRAGDSAIRRLQN